MSVLLEAIIENNFDFEASHTFAKHILKKLKELNFPHSINYDGSIDDSEYQYYINETDGGIFSIDIETPTPYAFEIRKNTVVISSIYRYSSIYKDNTSIWFQQFRKQLFEISNLFNANELIFTSADVRALSFYLDLIYNNKPYAFIKENLIEKFGKPVTEYKNLSDGILDYDYVNEWFLENFTDLNNNSPTPLSR